MHTFGILGVVVGLTAALVYSYRLSYRSRAIAEKWQNLLSHLPWFGAGVRTQGERIASQVQRVGIGQAFAQSFRANWNVHEG